MTATATPADGRTGVPWREWLRTYRTATWLAWQIEENWTDPFVFAIYSVVRPLAGTAILVVMYAIISGDLHSPLFAYIYVGNAFYLYVGYALNGMFWGIFDDREHYKMLKYFYTAPVNIPAFLLGRSTAQVLLGTIRVAITILVGVLVVHLPVRAAAIDYPVLVAGMLIGPVMLAMLALLFSGLFLLTSHQSMMVGDALAGALLLLTGAVFPIDVLPSWLQPVACAIPVTYWLEVMRRALIPDVVRAGTSLSAMGTPHLLATLIASTLVMALAAVVLFRVCDRAARERGLIDRVSNY